MEENRDNFSKLILTRSLLLQPKNKTVDETIQELNNPNNYGRYISNLRNNVNVNKHIESHFGPSNPKKKKSIEEKLGVKFPPKTKENIDSLIKQFNVSPNILSFRKGKNGIIFNNNENPTKLSTKRIIEIVMSVSNTEYILKEVSNV
jgi:hypothetical protein